MSGLAGRARNAMSVKAHNRRLLLLALMRRQPISRIRLARITALSTTTVTNLVAELMEQGLVEEVGTDLDAVPKGAGRPPQALRTVPDSRFALGIQIGVRRVRIGLCNLCAQVVRSLILPLIIGEAPQDALARICAGAEELLVAQGLAKDSRALVGVGVGASGLVEYATGVNLLAPNLGWRQVPIRELVARRLGLPVAVDNNVRCMALAESLFGAGQDVRALALVYARVGVGAGLVVDGRIYRGAGYGAGEIGHWIMAPAQGDEPDRSLEDLVSERTLVALAHGVAPAVAPPYDPADPNPLDGLFAAAREGHTALRRMLNERARYVGLALANLVDVLNPELVLLGGYLYEGFDLLQPVIEETMRRRAFGSLADRVRIGPTSFGRASGEVGAATLAFDRFLLG